MEVECARCHRHEDVRVRHKARVLARPTWLCEACVQHCLHGDGAQACSSAATAAAPPPLPPSVDVTAAAAAPSFELEPNVSTLARGALSVPH